MAEVFYFHHLYYDLVFKVCLDFYAGDRQAVAEAVRKKYHYEIRDNCLGESVVMEDLKEKTETQVIWIADVSNFYTLSHELIHMVKNVFEKNKIPFAPDNDETIAYYHTYWFRRIWHDMGIYNDKKYKPVLKKP